MRVAGIMSGTSLDGVDVAIVDIAPSRRMRVVGWRTVPYPRDVRDALLGVSNAPAHTAEIARLHFLLPELYAEAVEETCRRAGVPVSSLELVGCHGQTIFHEGSPVRYHGRAVASTLQIGDGSVLAERLGVPVVSDFRPRDIAAGGAGAPLVPFVDYVLYRHRRRARAALNIGGIANVTLIPPGARLEDVLAFDTGPGNMVMDGLAAHASGGKHRYDKDGRLAARGRVIEPLLDRLLRDPYYRRRPPKSAGREQYGKEFLARLLATGHAVEDLAATATALTAGAIATAIERFALAPPDDLIVSGGGLHNPRLMAYLAAFLPRVRITTSSEWGIDPDAKEAVAFALLAHETWRRRPGNVPAATGARRAVVLGKISP